MHFYARLQFIHIKYNTKHIQNEFTGKGAFRTFPVTQLGRTEQTGSFYVPDDTHMLALGHYILIVHGRVIIIIITIINLLPSLWRVLTIIYPKQSMYLLVLYITLQRFCRHNVHVMLFPMINVVYLYNGPSRSMCTVSNTAVFCSHASQINCSDAFWMILRCFQFLLLLLLIFVV